MTINNLLSGSENDLLDTTGIIAQKGGGLLILDEDDPFAAELLLENTAVGRDSSESTFTNAQTTLELEACVYQSLLSSVLGWENRRNFNCVLWTIHGGGE